MVYADIETKSFGPGEEGDGTPSGMQRAWHAHLSGLKATYHRLVAGNPAHRDPRIDLLIDPMARPAQPAMPSARGACAC